MGHLRKATLALPVVLILIGLAVPVVVDGGSSRPPAPPDPPRYAGRTAAEWHELAMRSLESGRLNMALKYMKTAERTAPGRQYGRELAEVRRARKKAAAAAENRRRMLEAEPGSFEIASDGRVTSAYREVVALPGESLWSLAGRLVAARTGDFPSDVADGDEVYDVWDALTDLNGVRELEVGEIVFVPLSDDELRAITVRNAADLERIRLASAALAGGDLEEAEELRASLETDFALNSEAADSLDRRISKMKSETLLASARLAATEALAASRISEHGGILESLRLARQKLEMARRLGADVPAALVKSIESFLSAAERYTIRDDGTIAARKPSGVAYTEFARSTVEWFLDRTLEDSGAEFPRSSLKSADELGWAEYMKDASSLAERGGRDFAELLVDTGERVVVLPNPSGYFDEGCGGTRLSSRESAQ
ncbi:MAG: hypothetical protein GF400_07535 [Candidatus Eisenbacteria bacterium]|nr:hypothetical protein [Candidatus Eisenbacteria bacterium]